MAKTYGQAKGRNDTARTFALEALQRRFDKGAGAFPVFTGPGKALTVELPNIGMMIDRMRAELRDEKMTRKIYRKALTGGGRIMLKAVQMLMPATGKRPRGKGTKPPPKYGATGATRKALSVFYRTGKGKMAAYIVVGVKRSYAIDAKRGKQIVKHQPSKTVHLLEKGFTAVARIPGIVGRRTNYSIVKVLRRFAGDRRVSLSKALDQGIDDKLLTSGRLKEKNKLRIAKYISAYRSAKRTKVQGKGYFEKARAASADLARDYVITVLAQEWDRNVWTWLRAA